MAEAIATTPVGADTAEVLEIGELVVQYLPRPGLLGLRHRDHVPGTEAWFLLPRDLTTPLGLWLADLATAGTSLRQWEFGDPEPSELVDVVDNLGRRWRRAVSPSHLWERTDGRGGVRTWRELTVGGSPLVEAGGGR